jgi:hypothetical protein
MSWITILWSMNAAACLTLAAFYFVVWLKQRENWVHLLFSCSAIAAAAISAFELWMMNATEVDQYELLNAGYMCPCGSSRYRSLLVRRYLHRTSAGERGVSTACERFRAIPVSVFPLVSISGQLQAFANSVVG